MLKLLLDMNLTPKLVPVLSDAGFECVHWSAVGVPDEDDRSIVEYARKEHMVVMTNDLDFGTILAETGFDFPSVLLLRYRNLSVPFLRPRIIELLRNNEYDFMEGALVVADERRFRVRLLPLR